MATDAEVAAARSTVLRACADAYAKSPTAWSIWRDSDDPSFDAIDRAARQLADEGLIRAQFASDRTIVHAHITPTGLEFLRSPEPTAGRDAPPTAVILTALECEFTAVRRRLTNIHEETHRGTVFEVGDFASATTTWRVALAQTGHGNPAAAAYTERALAVYQPDVALFVGVAGRIKDAELGDTVAATKAYGYERGKDKKDFEPRPDVGVSSYELVERAKAEARAVNGAAAGYRAFVGPIAAGEKVVASNRSATRKFLQRQYGDALAVEMEGRGFLEAVYANSQVRGIVLRGISDLLSGKKKADVSGSQDRASANAADFAFRILDKFLPSRGRGTSPLTPDNPPPSAHTASEAPKAPRGTAPRAPGAGATSRIEEPVSFSLTARPTDSFRRAEIYNAAIVSTVTYKAESSRLGTTPFTWPPCLSGSSPVEDVNGDFVWRSSAQSLGRSERAVLRVSSDATISYSVGFKTPQPDLVVVDFDKLAETVASFLAFTRATYKKLKATTKMGTDKYMVHLAVDAQIRAQGAVALFSPSGYVVPIQPMRTARLVVSPITVVAEVGASAPPSSDVPSLTATFVDLMQRISEQFKLEKDFFSGQGAPFLQLKEEGLREIIHRALGG